MSIRQSSLRQAATSPIIETAKSVTEASRAGKRTAFLCHSHADKILVKGFVNFAREKGWDLYVDWQDASLPEEPDRTTASKIKERIVSCDIFIFLATGNSMASRWCPWEIGFADGKKPINKIVIVPTTDDRGAYFGSEYLQLYRRIDFASDGRLAAFDPGGRQGVYASAL